MNVALGGFAAVMASGYVVSAFRSESCDTTDWWRAPHAGYARVLLGLPPGAATGARVVVTSEKQGCAWWAPTLGAYAGTAAGAGLAYIAFRSDEASCRYAPILLVILAGAGPVSGAVIGCKASIPCFIPRRYEHRSGLQIPRVVSILRAVDPPQSGAETRLVSERT